MTYNTINIKLNQNQNLICYLIQNIHSISNDREATLSVINMREGTMYAELTMKNVSHPNIFNITLFCDIN